MANTKRVQKEQARYLYFNTALTQKEIARTVHVTAKTLCDWVRKENWAQQKNARYYSPAQETHQLYEQLRAINDAVAQRPEGERFCTREELDLKSRIIRMITELKKALPTDLWRNTAPETFPGVIIPPASKPWRPWVVCYTDGNGIFHEKDPDGWLPPELRWDRDLKVTLTNSNSEPSTEYPGAEEIIDHSKYGITNDDDDDED